jgi:peptidoglycan/LPS O-acetylase OafA/YrhL
MLMKESQPETPARDTAPRLVSVDVLRGLAALAVVGTHVPHLAPGGWREHIFYWPSFLLDYGDQGVPLFVVISGFCIHLRAAKTESNTGHMSLDWRRFWLRRFQRLYPPYVAAIIFSLFCNFALHQRFLDSSTPLASDVTAHLLMVHNLSHDYGRNMGNAAFWSLGTEEQLYAL